MPLCNPLRELIAEPAVILIYGPAGAGKTTLALELLSSLCASSCMYFSTERLDFLKRAETLDIDLRRIRLYTAIDAYDFLDLLVLRSLPGNDVIVVDSINPFARHGGLEYQLTALLAAALYKVSEDYGVYIIETAQVSMQPSQPAAHHPLRMWAHVEVKLEKRPGGIGEAVVYKPPGTLRLRGEYRLTGRGFEWVNC